MMNYFEKLYGTFSNEIHNLFLTESEKYEKQREKKYEQVKKELQSDIELINYFPERGDQIAIHRLNRTRFAPFLTVNQTEAFCRIISSECDTKTGMQVTKCNIDGWYDFYEIQLKRKQQSNDIKDQK